MASLGEEHVGYRRLDYPMLKLSIVGGRPFSCGGQQLFRKRLLAARLASFVTHVYLRITFIFVLDLLRVFCCCASTQLASNNAP